MSCFFLVGASAAKKSHVSTKPALPLGRGRSEVKSSCAERWQTPDPSERAKLVEKDKAHQSKHQHLIPILKLTHLSVYQTFQVLGLIWCAVFCKTTEIWDRFSRDLVNLYNCFLLRNVKYDSFSMLFSFLGWKRWFFLPTEIEAITWS